MGVTRGTRALNRACGLFGVLFGFAVIPLSLWPLFWAWLAWQTGDWLYVAYDVAVSLLWIGAMLTFLREYDRWQKRKGLQ